MDWSNERYVRVYTRDTTTWKLMDWRGRVVLQLLIRKVDRAGVLDVGHDGVLGLAAVLELPIDIAEAGIAQLTTSRGGTPTVLDTGTAYVLPNFIDAQEAPTSDPQRKRESRARRRDRALAVGRGLLLTAGSDPDGHETGRGRDENADEVTPIRSDPSLSGSELPPPRAILPAPDPAPTPTTTVAPAPIPEMDKSVHSAPALAELEREARRRVQLELRAELERERREVAADLGVTDHGLLAQDPGERELALHLVSAGPDGLEMARRQALHAIAMAGLEARADASKFQWLTGAIFGERNFRRLVATTAAEAKRASPIAKGAAQPASPRPRRKSPTSPPIVITADERAAATAELAAAKALLGISDGARAPPASATSTEQQQPQPGKATAT